MGSARFGWVRNPAGSGFGKVRIGSDATAESSSFVKSTREDKKSKIHEYLGDTR